MVSPNPSVSGSALPGLPWAEPGSVQYRLLSSLFISRWYSDELPWWKAFGKVCGWVGDALSRGQNLEVGRQCFVSIPKELDSVFFMKNDVWRNIALFSPNQLKWFYLAVWEEMRSQNGARTATIPRGLRNLGCCPQLSLIWQPTGWLSCHKVHFQRGPSHEKEEDYTFTSLFMRLTQTGVSGVGCLTGWWGNTASVCSDQEYIGLSWGSE